MLTTVSDVLDRAKTRIGALAERAQDPTLSASDADDPLLEAHLADAIVQLAKDTDRLEATLTLTTAAGEPSIDLPPHVDLIQEARIHDSRSFEMKVYNGPETARAAQAPDADEGRPTFIGQHGGSLWLHPVPDDAYDLVLIGTLNGAHGDTPPADDTEPPTLDELVEMVPPELERAVVRYVVAEWYADQGEGELAQADRRRYERDLAKYDTEPRQQRTHTRRYMPLGGIT